MANKKASPPDRTSSWDLAAFEEKVSGETSNNWWNSNTTSGSAVRSKKVTRVQDLALRNLDSSAHSVEPNEGSKNENDNSTWPFESSPCRMFGGKNTRGGQGSEADLTNEQLFDRDFADRATTTKFDPQNDDEEEEDEETSIEDENASEDDEEEITDQDESVDTDSHSFYGDKSTDGSSHNRSSSTLQQPQPPSLLTTNRQRTSVPINNTGGNVDRDSDLSGQEDSAPGGLPSPQQPSLKTKARSKSDVAVRQPSKTISPNRQKRRTRQSSEASKKSEGSGGSSSALSTGKIDRKSSKVGPTAVDSKPSNSIMKKAEKMSGAEGGRTLTRKKSSSRLRPEISSSFHGGSPPVRSSGARRRGLNRAKSSDGMEGMTQGARGTGGGLGSTSAHNSTWSRKGRKRHDDSLSVASAHTSGSLGNKNGRATSGNRRSGRSKERNLNANSGLDRRGTLTRAMSTTNVKRPEEYGGGHIHHGSEGPGAATSTTTRSSIDQKRRATSSSRDREKETRSSSRGAEVAAAEGSTTTQQEETATATAGDQPKNRPRLRRRSSTTRLGRSGSSRSLASTGGGETSSGRMRRSASNRSLVSGSKLNRSGSERSLVSTDADSPVKTSSKQHHQSSSVVVPTPDAPNGGETADVADGHDAPTGSEAPQQSASGKSSSRSSKRRSSSRDRRDLMVLLRERRTIQPADLMDKENRRLLHFLMYEHKMGISQKELIRRIREEKESS